MGKNLNRVGGSQIMNKLHETRKLLEEILAEAETLVANKISNEILAWVADNVVYFIDNKKCLKI